MKTTLQIQSGPHAGQETEVVPGRSLLVGRSLPAGFLVPEDEGMAKVHFAIECQPGGCRIKDLNSESGTLLNGQRVNKTAVLNNGDQITAGQTVFVISMPTPVSEVPPQKPVRTAAPVGPSSAALSVVAAAAAAATAATRRGSWPQGGITCVEKKWASGVSAFFPTAEVIGVKPTDVLSRLHGACPAFMILNPVRLPEPVPDDVPRVGHLFEWLPPEAAAQASPFVVAAVDTPLYIQLAEKAWGKGALLCVFSRQGKPAILKLLRALLRSGPHEPEGSPPDAILGYFSPPVCGMMLGSGLPDLVERMMPAIEAVMIEGRPPAAPWQIFAKTDFVKVLNGIGIARIVPAKDPAPPPQPAKS